MKENQEYMGNNLWPKRLFTLDVSRGFAALAVVLTHWSLFAFDGGLHLSEDYNIANLPLYAVLKIFYEYGYLAVAYFFLVSGFIFFWLYRSSIENKDISFGIFWIQRISRLYPLHFVTLLIVALLQTVYISQNGNSFIIQYNDMYHFFLNLGFVSNWGFESSYSFNSPVWSVSIEIFAYFVFFMVAYNRQGGALFCLGISVMSVAIIPLTNNVLLFKGMAAFFLGGFVFYLTLYISTRLQKLKAVIYIIAAFSWLLTIVDLYVFNLVSDFILGFGGIGKVFLMGFPYSILFPFTLCSLALIGIDNGQCLKPISWIGDITYSSYLLHFPLMLVFALALSYGRLNSDFYLNSAYLVVFFLILIPLSYITFIGFERPMQNIIRNQCKHDVKV